MTVSGNVSGNRQASSTNPLLSYVDGSGWSDLLPLRVARGHPAAAVLRDGKVLVAGGMSGPAADTALKTAELWDPATQVWTALPPIAHKRSHLAACVLPSGRVAVVAGTVFDPVKREWEPLGVEMPPGRGDVSAVAVAGGLVVVGQAGPPELYDEGSGRWLMLPHTIAEPRWDAGLISLPTAAVVAPTTTTAH